MTDAELKVPMIATWMGTPISELPRDELERLFCEAHERIQLLESEACRRSVEHIHDLAEMARRRSRGRMPRIVTVLTGTK